MEKRLIKLAILLLTFSAGLAAEKIARVLLGLKAERQIANRPPSEPQADLTLSPPAEREQSRTTKPFALGH
jgi:hypothetical protein